MGAVLYLHNYVRWFILLFAILVIVNGVLGMGGKRPFGKADKRNALLLMICCDIQLLLGLVLYFANGYFHTLVTGGSEMMKNTFQRFYAMEHNVAMLIAIILIHIGYRTVKMNITDQAKFKRLFWFTLIALVIILVSIPWPFRADIGRPLLRV